MFSYLKAELYRTRKRMPNILLLIFGLIGIGLSYYVTAKYSTTKSSSTFLSNVYSIVQQVVPFMAIMIATASFKRREEMRNYFQRGMSRLNPVIGDYLVSVLTTIVFAFIFTAITVALSYTFKDLPAEKFDIYITPKMFIYSILTIVSMIICMLGGIHLFYELTNLQGATVAISFLYYFFAPIIFKATGLVSLDSWLGRLADWFTRLSPLEYGPLFDNLFQIGLNPFEEKWFGIMLFVNIFVASGIRYLVIKRKRY